MNPEPVQVLVNEKWPLLMTPHRAARPSWPVWEKERLAAMHSTIRAGDVVYDIGAEEGDFPALFATWGARLMLIEPNPFVWPNIRYHWEANQLDPPVGWFVGLYSDTTDLEPELPDIDATERDGWPECAYGELIPDHGFRHLWEHAVSTPQVTLDDLVERIGVPPDVITMDVEGGEGHVLRGARLTLQRHRPVVFVSIHPEFMADLYGEHPVEIHTLMADLGYAERFIAQDHEIHMMFIP